MWSFGTIIAELYTGYPLFPGEDELEQLAYIMEIYGVPEKEVLKISTRRHLFFNNNNEPILTENSRGKVRKPNTKTLTNVLKCKDPIFLDFLNQCLVWNPVERMTPNQALQHQWILQGLPDKVLKHHQKMLVDGDDKETLKMYTYTDIQGFPKDKKNATIHDIVEEVKKDDAKKHRKQNSELDMLKSERLLKNSEPMAVAVAEPKDISPMKERKSRKQRRGKQSNKEMAVLSN